MSVEKFIAAARAHAMYTEQGNSILTNKAYDDVAAAREVMRNLPDHGTATLKELLTDGDSGVRLCAAYYLLPTATALAVDTLKDIASDAGLVGFSAEMTLKEWNAGNLKIE